MSWTVFVVFALLPFHNLMITAEQCLPGTFHKETSSPGGNAYAECQAWNEDTCCTANFTMELNQNRVKNLYNFHWGHCKNLSQACETFILAEECFFSCEPRLINWKTTFLEGIPVCGDYCDEWYKACENDYTCVENWLSGFNYTNNVYTCPRESKCRTFKQIYGSGKNLCNKMWGSTFVYVDSKYCPCTRLDEPIPTNVNRSSTCSPISTEDSYLPMSSSFEMFPIPTDVNDPPTFSASGRPSIPNNVCQLLPSSASRRSSTPTNVNRLSTSSASRSSLVPRSVDSLSSFSTTGSSSSSTILPFNSFLITLQLSINVLVY